MNSRYVASLMACMVLVALFTACQPVVAPSEPTVASEEMAEESLPDEPAFDPLEVGDPDRGRELFMTGGEIISAENRCVNCHTLDGTAMDGDPAGPSIQGVFVRARERMTEESIVDYLRQSIVDPSAYVVEGFKDKRMPKAYDYWLGEENVNHLVAFMLTQ